MTVRVRARVVVHGRVQGVWFRESCRRQAEELGVHGWVRNRMDDTVEAEFEGTEPGVARAVAWCRDGPPAAEVAGVDVEMITPVGDARGFTVR
ncbi:acylphosphatase [soil metagenome]